jgi:DNA-directed RNA polymerase subunit L
MNLESLDFKRVKDETAAQDLIRESKSRISGPVGFDLKEVLLNSTDLLAELKDTMEGEINLEAIQSMAEDLGIKDKKLEESFNKGLSYNIKAAFKSGLLDKHSSDQEIKELIAPYTFNFRSTLRNFQKNTQKDDLSSPSVMLNIANKSYLLPADIIPQLKKKYEDNELVTEGVISSFAISNPTNPEAAIERTLQIISELKEKYEDNKFITDSVISRIAINSPTNPEAAIENALQTISELKEKYKDNEILTDGMINYFSIHYPTNPEVAIDNALQTISELQEKYKDNELVTNTMINHFAVYNSNDPKAAIEKFLSKETK